MISTVLAAVVALVASPGGAQPLTGAPADPQFGLYVTYHPRADALGDGAGGG
jgi:hypothetical protein